ncbi:MAG: helicase associated domain-containing protein, partial [Candidatus Ornithomonoglobus sp.]
DAHVKMLNEIGMLWSKNNALWERNYLEAERYYREHGNLKVPHNYITEGGVKLGAWIDKLKKLNGGSTRAGAALSAEQKDRLTAIGMEWDSKYVFQWKNAYRAACEYYRQHGNFDIPSAYKTKDGIALGAWIRRQRSNKKLTEEQRIQLDRIGMIWNTVPKTYVTEKGFKLSYWINGQRKAYKKGTLKYEQVEQLREIGIV